MSTLIVILRPSLALPNSWKIQIDGLMEDQMNKLVKKIDTKYKKDSISDLISIRWRVDENEAVMPINHIAPLVNLFEGWGYKLNSCEKGIQMNRRCEETDVIFWTLIRKEGDGETKRRRK